MPLSEERRSLGKRDGRPGFEVTALGLGCGTIAGVPSDADALSAVTTAVDIGFGFFGAVSRPHAPPTPSVWAVAEGSQSSASAGNACCTRVPVRDVSGKSKVKDPRTQIP